MPESSERLLSYNRIDINRRKTRALLAAFAALLFPFVSGATQFAMPMVVLLGLSTVYAMLGQEAAFTLLGPPPSQADSSGPIELTDLPSSVLLLQGGVLLVALIAVVIGFVAVTMFLIMWYGSHAVLRMSGARRVERDHEPELIRAVENLCIAAGLPRPAIYVVESPAPNAFAVGRDPQHASLIVTRGLLALLDRRELEGVIAHELSHIGNHDIRLSTTLAALVTTLRLPFRFVTAPFRFVFRLPWTFRALALFIMVQPCLLLIQGYAFSFEMFFDETTWERAPSILWWLELHAMLTHFHIFYLAPLAALLIRHAVSRQREYLADADAAQLTRDPEGLALALIKVATARGKSLRFSEGTVHLYFADPRQDRGSWMQRLFPSHPPVEERIKLLARMGSGIVPEDLRRAQEAGARAEAKRIEAERLEIQRQRSQADQKPAPTKTRAAETPTAASVKPPSGRIPLYEKPDGWSRVLTWLPPDAVLKVVAGEQGAFIRVVTANDVAGFVSRNAGLLQLSESGRKGIA